MDNLPVDGQDKLSRDAASWAKPVSKLKVDQLPEGATNINVEGLQVASPMQGFGQLWQKTFRVRLTGCKLSPPEVVQIWKKNFTRLQPEGNRFYPTPAGVTPGELMFIDSSVPVVPNTAGILPITTGVMVMYADDAMFTVITPEGHPESGWNTFSAYDDNGMVVAQIQSLTRATDPIYEFGFRFMGGSQMQDKTWSHVLRSLAKACGVYAEVSLEKQMIDSRLQWSAAKNIWKNAVLRTMLFRASAPLRWLRKRFSARIA